MMSIVSLPAEKKKRNSMPANFSEIEFLTHSFFKVRFILNGTSLLECIGFQVTFKCNSI